MSAAPGSALARARAAFEARQKAADPIYVNIWQDGSLVAQVKRPANVDDARDVLRTMASLTVESDQLTITEENLAEVIATATVNLGCRDDADGFIPAGDTPTIFDAAFAAEMGWPDGLAAADMVCFAFTEGSPPELNTVALMICATNVATRLAVREALPPPERAREDAIDAVGEA